MASTRKTTKFKRLRKIAKLAHNRGKKIRAKQRKTAAAATKKPASKK